MAMDYWTYDAQYEDSVSFISPTEIGSDNRYLKAYYRYNKKLSKLEFAPILHYSPSLSDFNPSSSYIIKETFKRQVLNRYTTNLSDTFYVKNPEQIVTILEPKKKSVNRPSIKISGIPKAHHTQTSSALYKDRQANVELKRTASNRESSLSHKCVGVTRHRDRVVKIKTTESANLYDSKAVSVFNNNDDISITNNILKSLNMETNRKNKKKKKTDFPDPCLEEFLKNCTCSVGSNKKELANGKSHVRITGRIGLTEDDRCVLRCAATVDGREVPTDFGTVEDNDGYKQKGNQLVKKKNEGNKTSQRAQKDAYGNETQGTQTSVIDENVSKAFKNDAATQRDQIVQCTCSNTNTTMVTDAITAINALKQCKSPVVVISVYPGQIKDIPEPTKTSARSQSPFPQRPISPNKLPNNNSRRAVAIENDNKKESNSTKPLRARSRSPSPNNFASPSRRTKLINQKKDTLNNKNTKSKEYLEPASSLFKNNTNTKRSSDTFKKNTAKKDKQQIKPRKQSLPSELAKKALIDSFTKDFMERCPRDCNSNNAKSLISKKNTSNVTVEIDGETEFYNVEFQQKDFVANLKVRKTTKGKKIKEPHDKVTRDIKDANTASLSNFLVVPDPRRRSASQVFTFNQNDGGHKNDAKSSPRPPSVLVVKDSLELKPKAKQNHNVKIQTTMNCTENLKVPDFYTPEKLMKGENYQSAKTKKNKRPKLTKNNKILNVSKTEDNKPKNDGGHIGYPQMLINLKDVGLLQPRDAQAFYKELFGPLQVKDSIQQTEPLKLIQDTKNFNNQKPNWITTFGSKEIGINTSADKIRNVIQTEIEKTLTLSRNIHYFLKIENLMRKKPVFLSERQYKRLKRKLKQNVTNKTSNSICKLKSTRSKALRDVKKRFPKCNDNVDSKAVDIIFEKKRIDVHYTNVEFNRISFASVKKPEMIAPMLFEAKSDANSLQTIFGGFKRSRTINLGTSEISLCPENKTNKTNASRNGMGVKKPFLRRLVSCLVMRLTKSDDKQLESFAFKPTYKAPSICALSSIDSYRIDSSFGPMDISSSLYDTSASFYSNHSIIAISSKNYKKGFFRSIQKFWPNRKT